MNRISTAWRGPQSAKGGRPAARPETGAPFAPPLGSAATIAFLCLAFGGLLAFGQGGGNAGTIRGTVLDPNGAVVAGATVGILDPVSQYSREAQSDAQGKFSFVNVPFDHYHMTASAPGFQATHQDVEVQSAVALEVKIGLKVGATTQEVTVTEAGDLLQTSPETHTDVSRDLFDKVPLESQTSELSSLVTLATPGAVADSNGLFHGLGDHASNSFSVDGQPITDQQSKVFSNQLPEEAVQSMQVIEGAPPAEYGDKTSLTVVVTTRSGLGQTTPHGDLTGGFGSFDTPTAGGDFSFGGKSWGNFISITGMNTHRFLDGPEQTVMHDAGNEGNLFDRIDFQPNLNNTFSIDLQATRSWFQTPNSYDSENATAWNGLVVSNNGLGPNGIAVGSQDQRSKIETYNFAPTWTHILGADALFTLGVYVRQDQYYYYPSANLFADETPDLQSESVAQRRRLNNAGARASYSKVAGHNNFKAGSTYEQWFLREGDTFGVVNPALNAPCLNADGSADTNPSITSQGQCNGGLTVNTAFVPLLGCYDLTRTANLPASDGCATNTSAEYAYFGRTNIKEFSVYAEDTLTHGPWTLSAGVRGDFYNGIATAKAAEPRLGFSYNVKKTDTVLRASYARTMETPFNENQVLASTGCSNPAINALMGVAQGYPCITTPESPGTRDEYHAGLTQAFGRFLVFDGEYIWKNTDRAFDFSVLGNTPITYPIEWDKSKIPGYAIRWSMPQWRGLSAFVVQAHVAARFFTPQVSGIGVTPTSTGIQSVFRIDHDENYEQTVHLQYQVGKKGPWVGFNWRYDSGLVAGPVPCAGGNCLNGPNGTSTVVDVSNLTPDQQFQAGLYCGATFATPTSPISANNLCAASQYGSKYLKIPAAGAENDDLNPPRVNPHNLIDLGAGQDNLFESDKYKVSLRLSMINVANTVGLYNFLSTFSGTHYITPRSYSATLGLHF